MGNITYIHLVVCFVYLAVILDIFSCKAIGYTISCSSDTQLELPTLRMAIENRSPLPGSVHHSDRSVQHEPKNYVKKLEFYRFRINMSLKGKPSGNAYDKSFIKT